jgi:3-methyladenine DNA glycosylase AlkD
MHHIKQKLFNQVDSKYKDFSSSLIPNIDNVLGVRLPVLRKIAKEIYTSENWQEFLQIKSCEFMEETMLQGMVIGLVQDKPQKILKLVKDFVPKIDNWSVCDSFCVGLKFVKKNKGVVWEFLQPYFRSTKEFEIRFAYVMALNYFVEEDYLEQIFSLTDDFKSKKYYAQMAVAWAISVYFAEFPDKTKEYLKHSNLSSFTLNKSIQKICDSNRVDKTLKVELKELILR